MKLSWKLFFITTPIFILVLTIFGSWLIQDNFQVSLSREIQRCMVENQMFQNSYELTRNSLTEEGIFQHELLSYNASYHEESVPAIQSFLDNTFMNGKVPGFVESYAYLFWACGKDLNISPFHLASRVLQEQGRNGTSALISGTYSGYEGYYNFLNIRCIGIYCLQLF